MFYRYFRGRVDDYLHIDMEQQVRAIRRRRQPVPRK